MKKLLFLLVGLLVLSLGLLIGCDKNPDNPPEEPPTATEYCYVTFKQDNLADIVMSVEKGKGLLSVPTPTAKTGHNVSWSVLDFTNIVEDVVVRAVYTPKTYTVIYDCNGALDSLPSFEVTYGEEYNLGTITFANDYFLYWTHNNQPVASSGVWTIDKDTPIYLYSKTQSKGSQGEGVYHSVTFVQQGGENVTPSTKTVLVKHGEGVNQEDIPETARIDGYNVSWDYTFDDLQNVTSDIVVSAVMTGKTYIITYDLQGGSMVGGLSNEQSVVYGENYTLRTASREGYAFRGWAYLTGFITDGEYKYAFNITVIAVWEEAL